jgi:hypothetical protein
MLTFTYSTTDNPSPRVRKYSIEQAFSNGQASFGREFARLSHQERLSLVMVLKEISTRQKR